MVIADAKLRYASRLKFLSCRIQRNAVCADRNATINGVEFVNEQRFYVQNTEMYGHENAY